MRWIVLLLFVVCAVYTHRRGKVRHGFLRQLSDRSTFMSPLNCFVYAFSSVPSKPYLHPALFPDLQVLRNEWQTIREEALALREASRIQAAQQYNDIGFNSFFRNGWRRFYLKWYDNPHPSAAQYCPRTLEILNRLPSVKAAMFDALGVRVHLCGAVKFD